MTRHETEPSPAPIKESAASQQSAAIKEYVAIKESAAGEGPEGARSATPGPSASPEQVRRERRSGDLGQAGSSNAYDAEDWASSVSSEEERFLRERPPHWE